MIDGLGHGDDC